MMGKADSTSKKLRTKTDLHEALKKNPVAFRQAADLTIRRGMGLPSAFMADIKANRENKGNADLLAVMTVTHSRPSNWQWDASDIQDVTGQSERSIERAVGTLKEWGWLGHVNVYIEGEILSTYLMIFDSRQEMGNRTGRYSLSLRGNRWRMKTPNKVVISVPLPAWTKGNPRVEPIEDPAFAEVSKDLIRDATPVNSPVEDAGIEVEEEGSMSPHHVRGHTSIVSTSQTLLRRALVQDLAPTATESEATPLNPEVEDESDVEESPSEIKPEDFAYRPARAKAKPEAAGFSRPIEEYAEDKARVEDLERLGRKATEKGDFHSKLEYEEFINDKILPRLLPPPCKTQAHRSKAWRLQWVRTSMWGLLFKQLSIPGEDWNNNQARRLVKRVEEGYVSPSTMRKVLYAFEWSRSRKTLEAWTFRGRQTDIDGNIEIADAWQRQLSNSYETIKREIGMELAGCKNDLYPAEADGMPEYTLAAIAEEAELWRGLDQAGRLLKLKGMFVLGGPDLLAYLTTCTDTPIPPEVKAILADGGFEWLVKWLHRNLNGVTVMRELGGSFHPELGENFQEEVVARHREYVPMLCRRLSNYYISTEGVDILI